MFLAATGAYVATRGLMLSRDLLFGWLLLGLLALSVTDVRRWARGVIFDWLPLLAVLLFYDLSHAVSRLVPIVPHVYPQIDFDRLLFGTPVPTVALQQALYRPPAVHWYDYASWFVYMTHFFATLLVAGLLWRFAYPRFRRFRTLVIALATLGFVTYVAFPAVPPWMASLQGHIGTAHRVVAEMWPHVGLRPAAALFENHSAFYNEVAAVPSLHAAYPMLMLLFFWAAGRWWRLGLSLYTLAMAFTLVYTAEHYVADIAAGWLYAAATYGGVVAVSRAWERRRGRSRAVGAYGVEPARAA